MIGTIFNTGMIIVGCLLGSLFRRGIKPAYREIMTQAIGLVAIAVGINAVVQHLPKSHYPVLFIVCMAVGGLLGEVLQLQKRFDRLVNHFSQGNLADGLATAILLYCIGALSILGPVEAALKHDYTFLFTNGMLDGITSIVLAATFGLGIMVAAAVVFCWQGGIYLLALLLKGAIATPVLNEVTIVGGLLILASGFSLLKIKSFNTLNLLPALFLPPVIIALLQLFHG